MGLVCSRDALGAYAALPGEDDDEDLVSELSKEMGGAFGGALGHLWVAGVVRWVALPVVFALGFVSCTCRAGLPTEFYVLPLLVAAFSWSQERRAVQCLARFLERVERKLGIRSGAEAEKLDPSLALHLDCFRNALDSCEPRCTWRVWQLTNHWLFLQVMGLSIQLDLFTDALVPGQVRICQLHDPALFKHRFAAAWAGVPAVGVTLNTLGLFGMFCLLLLFVLFVQGYKGLEQVRLARRAVKTLSRSNTAGRFAGDSPHEDLCRRASMISSSGVVAGECAAAYFAKAVFLALAGQFAYTLGKHKGHSELTALRAEEAARQRIEVSSVIRNTLFQQLPLMYLTLSFFALIFDAQTFEGQVKLAVSYALSLRTAITTALFTLHRTSCGSRYLVVVPLLSAAVILAASALLTAKFAMVFFCEGHVFSLFDFTCVDERDVAAVLESHADFVAALRNSPINGTIAALEAPLAGLTSGTLPQPLASAQAAIVGGISSAAVAAAGTLHLQPPPPPDEAGSSVVEAPSAEPEPGAAPAGVMQTLAR